MAKRQTARGQTPDYQAQIDELRKQLTSGQGDPAQIREQINGLRSKLGKPALTESQLQKISGGTAGSRVDPTTGLTKTGMIEVTPQDQIRPQVQADIGEALKQGKTFGDLIGQGSFKTIGGQGSALGNFLDRNKALAEQASQFSGREEQSISEMEKGLQGYNSQEV